MAVLLDRQTVLTALGVVLVHALMLGALHRAMQASQTAPVESVSLSVATVPQVQSVQLLGRTGKGSSPVPIPSRLPRATPEHEPTPTRAPDSPLTRPAAHAPENATAKVVTAMTAPDSTATVSNGSPLGSAPKSPSASMGAGNRVNAESSATGSAAGSPGTTGAPGPVSSTSQVVLPDGSPRYLNNPEPVYPTRSRQQGEQGRVVLKVWVSAAGAAQRVEVATSSGFERLDAAAITTVQSWRFVPGQRGGQAQAMTVLVPIPFSLTAP